MKNKLESSSAASIEEKRALLAELLRAPAGAGPMPLSYGQKALYFLHRSEPESSAYHVAFSARFRSPVDIEALRRALQRLVDRHEQLRARFVLRDGEPVQEIAPRCPVAFEPVEASSWSEEKLDGAMREAYRRPFDLERGPVFRSHLFTVAEDHHVFLITIHHIVYDAWSLWINLSELGSLYRAEVDGIRMISPPVARSYFDFVHWQTDLIKSPESTRLWTYWQNQLQGDLAPIKLPTDRPRPPVQTYAGATMEFKLGPDLAYRLKQLARRQGVTPFMLLLAAFQVLLHRYSGQEEILVGSPSAGRNQSEYAQTVGYFVNTLVLKAELSSNPSFQEVLSRVQKTVLGALEHQDYPFPLLIERLQPTRNPSYSPVVQVSFVYQKPLAQGGNQDLFSALEPGKHLEWGGLDIEYYPLAQQEGQFDLELEIVESGSSFHGSFKYNKDLFEPSSIGRMVSHFEVLLEGIVARPNNRIGHLPLLTASETQRLLHCDDDDNGVPRSGCRDTLTALFEAQVDAWPDAIAVTDLRQHLTYRELNIRADKLAHHLRRLGVGPEVLVGIYLERSTDLIVGILGILKAGGAYLPLDPAYPKERLAFMLGDSKAPVIVTQRDRVGALPETPVELVYIDGDWEWIDEDNEENPSNDVHPNDLAYVIYTSGSTGEPKGVQITHFNVTRLMAATHDWYQFDERDVWTMFHSCAFDFSVWEIWGALLYGGRLVVVPFEVSRDAVAFYRLLADEKVTVLNQTPSAFSQLIRVEDGLEIPLQLHLRWVIFGGEKLDLHILKPWFMRHGDQTPKLINMYGITETTVHVTYRPLSSPDLAREASVIGRPIPDLRLYILDQYLQPAPVGVVGELYVAGSGLARGYLNRPDLTHERFIRNPFSKSTDDRLYKTGDLARHLPDGDIEYLGRIDSQVKIRGFRIELGEIEHTLCQHPQVVGSVVVTRNAPSGDLCLVGYVTGPEATPEVADALRCFLKERLPDYCVPTALVILDHLPLNHNGKVDRGALPAPELWSGLSERQVAEPRDAWERTITGIWEDVLGVRPIGLFDNFFDLGGHSLWAIRLMADIQKELGITLSPATLFKAPTVEQLAAVIRERQTGNAWSPLVPIQPEGKQPPFFCVAGGGGSVLYYQPLARYLGTHQPFYGLQAKGVDGESQPFDRVEDMAACYIEEIRRVQPNGPYRLGGHCFGAVVAFEMAQQLVRSGEEIALLVVLNVPAPCAGRSEAVCDLDDGAWVVKLGRLLEQASGQDLALRYEDIKLLDPEAQLEYLRNRMLRAGFLPPEAGVAPVRGLIQVLKANGRIEYLPENPVRIPLALLRAEKFHPEYDFSSAEYPVPGERDETLGWGAYASRPVTVKAVPGDHITMLAEPNVKQVAVCLGALLAETRAASVDPEPGSAALTPSASIGQELLPVQKSGVEDANGKLPAGSSQPPRRHKPGAIASYAQWLLRWRYLVMVLILGLVGWAAAGIAHLHFKNDYRMFFSEENPELTAFETLQNTYTRNDNILIVLAPKGGEIFTRENLALVEEVTAAAWKIPYSIRVDSLTNFQYSRGEADELVVADLVKDAARLEPAEIETIEKIALADPLLVKRLISPSGHVTGINVIVQRPGLNQMDETQEVTDFVRRVIKDRIRAKRPDVDVYLTGSVMMDAAFADASEHDGQTLTPLMSAIIVVTLIGFLRSLAGTLVTITVIALSIVTALGLAGWLGIALSPSSVPAPTILLTLAVADSVHVLMSYYDGVRSGLDKYDAMTESLKLNLSAVFFTSLTTAISFLSMNFSDAPPFRDLGNITAMGVIAAFILSMALLPALTVLFPAPKPRKVAARPTGLLWLAERVIRRYKSWYLLVLVLTGVSISFITRNELNDEFVEYFATGTDFRDATDFTTDNLTGIYYIDYSLEAPVSGGATDPAFLRKVEEFADWWRKQPEALHVFSITDVFKRLHKNLHGDDPAWYRLPESQEMSAQYLLLYEMSLPFGLDLNDRINVDKSATRLSVTLKSLSSNEVLALEERARYWLAANAPEIRHAGGTGLTMMFAHIGSRNITSMIGGELLSIFLISFILMIVLRSVTMGLISMIPNLLPAAMAFGLWGLMVGRVGLASSVVAAMTLGILVDDTVHFLGKYLHARRKKGLSPEDALRYAFASVGKAIWVTSAVLMSGFALLAVSDFKINAEMGLLTAIIFGLGLFAEFLLLPPLLLTIEGLRLRTKRWIRKPIPLASTAGH